MTVVSVGSPIPMILVSAVTEVWFSKVTMFLLQVSLVVMSLHPTNHLPLPPCETQFSCELSYAHV